MQVETRQPVSRKQFQSHFFSVLTRLMQFIQTIRMYTVWSSSLLAVTWCALLYVLVVDNPLVYCISVIWWVLSSIGCEAWWPRGYKLVRFESWPGTLCCVLFLQCLSPPRYINGYQWIYCSDQPCHGLASHPERSRNTPLPWEQDSFNSTCKQQVEWKLLNCELCEKFKFDPQVSAYFSNFTNSFQFGNSKFVLGCW